MVNIKLYTVSDKYIDYLSIYAPHLFHNKNPNQIHKRVYIGVILKVHGMDYFAPLSSYKEKYKQMKETLDFIKVKTYSVINLNNMFPVQSKDYTYLDFSKEQDLKYKSLLESEYRYIKSIQGKIIKNASLVYKIKTSGKINSLTKRCNDFKLLEEKCRLYK